MVLNPEAGGSITDPREPEIQSGSAHPGNTVWAIMQYKVQLHRNITIML